MFSNEKLSGELDQKLKILFDENQKHIEKLVSNEKPSKKELRRFRKNCSLITELLTNNTRDVIRRYNDAKH